MSEKRKQVLQNLGGKCVKCGSIDKLHLHHIKYAKDSVKWDDKSEDSKRVQEALDHPERFELLCTHCHGHYHRELRIKNRTLSKPRAMITCKICKWVYFPEEIKEHEASCDGKSPMDRIREKSLKQARFPLYNDNSP